jgi:transposase
MPGKNIPSVIKCLIIEAKQKSEKDRAVADRFHVSQKSISKVYKRWREERTVERRSVSGRPRKNETPS